MLNSVCVSGRIIKEYLSIHEIQQILLQQSQNLGKDRPKEALFAFE
jgi:hypothetical protein